MKYYKLLIIMLGLVAIFGYSFALAASGQACDPASAESGLCNAIPSFGGIEITDIKSLFEGVLSWLATVIGTLALVSVFYSGVQMIFSRGDSTAVSKAKTSLTYSIVGLVVVVFAFVIVSSALNFIGATNTGTPGQIIGGLIVNPLTSSSFRDFFDSTKDTVLGLLGVVTILYIVLSGFRYITSGGNEEQAKKAKQGLTWAVIGLISVILSYLIVTVVVNTLENLG